MCMCLSVLPVHPHPHRGGFNMVLCRRVEEIAYPTPKQAKKNIAKTKSNVSLKQTCGRIKTATPT
jgi:hypothetical protein